MSRCFPYPPPGYTLSRSVEEALIESVKLQRERLKVKELRVERKKEKQEKKEKRREHKEKRRERKEKRKENQEKVKLSLDEHDSFKKGGCTGDSIWANAEQLEKSGLTEEHGQPICLRSTSSESSEDSNKRKRPSLTDNNCCHGRIIRIKLSKKQDVPNVSSNCYVPSVRTEIPLKKDISFINRQGTSFSPEGTSCFGEATHRTDNELTCSISGNNSLVTSGRIGVPCFEEPLMTSIQKQELQYRNLTENFVLPHFLDSCLSPDDLDWLLCSKDQGGLDVKRQKYETDVMSCFSSSLLAPPRACYLPQAEVYALPYTIPF